MRNRKDWLERSLLAGCPCFPRALKQARLRRSQCTQWHRTLQRSTKSASISDPHNLFYLSFTVRINATHHTRPTRCTKF